MKILIVANSDSGLYQFRRELVEKLVNEYDIAISVPKGEYFSYFEKLGCEMVDTKINRRGINILKDLKLMDDYRRILKRVHPNVVLTYTIKPNVYCGLLCSLNKIPYIANITGLGTAVENPGIMQFITTTLYRIAFRNIDTVFFQNKANERFFLEKTIALGKHKMIPGSGVNLNDFLYQEYPNDNTIEFAFVARIMKEKGIEQYLETAQYIRKKYTNTVFHVCGTCEEEYQGLLEQLTKDGIINYHGNVSDMKAIYGRIQCLIHPTYYPEGMSNVMLEAAATGRCLIATRRPGCKEIIEENVNGYFTKEKNNEDLIHQVEKFIALSYEERKKMGIKSREKVEKEFDRKIVINSYLEEINRALNKNR